MAILQDIINQVKTVPSNAARPTSPGTTHPGSENGASSPAPARPANPNRIYILGPMRGRPQYNFPAFYAMAEKLIACGYEPVNPADLDRRDGFRIEDVPATQDWTKYPEGMDSDAVVRRDIAAIMTCEGYVALPGWENSTGARAEKAVFDWRGIQRLYPSGEGRVGFFTSPIPGSDIGPADATNPKDIAGTKKTPLRLVPWVSIIQLARVMKLGADKYGEVNWREKKPRLTVYFEAALRHLLAYADGQNTDPESGESHLAHVMANMAILLDAESCNCLLDDRKSTGEVVKLLSVIK